MVVLKFSILLFFPHALPDKKKHIIKLNSLGKGVIQRKRVWSKHLIRFTHE